MGPSQVGGGIGPLELVDSWIGYGVSKQKKIIYIYSKIYYNYLSEWLGA